MPPSASGMARVTKAEQRRIRLDELEREQYLEDVEALRMTEEQHQVLLRSFMSVKFEFSDLDGQDWSRDSQRDRWRHVYRTPPAVPPLPPNPRKAVAVQAGVDPRNVYPETTIRASKTPSPPPRSCSYLPTLSPSSPPRRRDGSRPRMPVKDAFARD